MARIRSIKPEFRTSLTVTSWPRDVRLFFALLWGYMDDFGRGVDEPRLIKADCFPLDEDITAATINEWLDLMVKDETIVRYQVGGKRFLAVVHWGRHQKPQHPRPSMLPAPEQADDPSRGASVDRSADPEGLTEFLMRTSRETHDDVTPEGRVGEGRGEGEVEEQDNPSSSEPAFAAPDFDVNIEPTLPSEPFATGPGGKNDRADVIYLCQLLAHLMVKNECKRPTITKQWLDNARLLLDKDGRDFMKAVALLRWCQNNSFWRSNIQSMPTFRTQYDQLRLKALAEWQKEHERLSQDRAQDRHHVDMRAPIDVPPPVNDPWAAELASVDNSGGEA